jgi:hypothetical protein
MPPCATCCHIESCSCCCCHGKHEWATENVPQRGLLVAVVICVKCKNLKRPIVNVDDWVTFHIQTAE